MIQKRNPDCTRPEDPYCPCHNAVVQTIVDWKPIIPHDYRDYTIRRKKQVITTEDGDEIHLSLNGPAGSWNNVICYRKSSELKKKRIWGAVESYTITDLGYSCPM